MTKSLPKVDATYYRARNTTHDRIWRRVKTQTLLYAIDMINKGNLEDRIIFYLREPVNLAISKQ